MFKHVRTLSRVCVSRGIPTLGLMSLFVLTGCMMRPGEPPAPSTAERPAPPDGQTAVSVRVDSARGLVVVEAGPFDVPPSTADAHGPGGHAEHEQTSPLIRFGWPLDGWYRGFRVRLVDQSGEPLPDGILHHVIGVNFDRRQVVYPVPERFLGVGTETRDILLPKRFGIPIERGADLGVYASWQNESDRPVEDVYLQVALAYLEPGPDTEPEAVVPIYIDTNNVIGGTNAYDLAPGHVSRSYEFELPVDGALLGLSGHLHDYGRSVRLEDAESGEVLVELEGIIDDEGRVQAVEQRIFRRLFGLLDDRIPLEKGKRYRVVGEYYNPTGQTIQDGAMAHLTGIFAPTQMGGWASVDTTSVAYRTDVAALPRPLSPVRSTGVDSEPRASTLPEPSVDPSGARASDHSTHGDPSIPHH